MIRSLTGTVQTIRHDSVVIDVNGVGYLVYFVSSELKVGESYTLHTYLAVRDDSLDLYGFVLPEELALFENLITVSGIGPKSAMTIIAKAGASKVSQSIEQADPARLIALGVGKKSAERIILDLAGKRGLPVKNDEALDALRQLGYRDSEAGEALRGIEGTVEERIRQALKGLQK